MALAIAVTLFLLIHPTTRAAEELTRSEQEGVLLSKEKRVDYYPKGGEGILAETNQWLEFKDSLKTFELSRATVRFTDWTQLILKDLTRLEIEQASSPTNSPSLRLHHGRLYVSSRGAAQTIPIQAPRVRVSPHGTEYTIQVKDDLTEVVMLNGEALLSNDATATPRLITNNERAMVAADGRIVVSAIQGRNTLVQWWLYYPAILDPDELGFTPAENALLEESLTSYRRGHLQQAVEKYPGYPTLREPQSEAERDYQAALLLAVGSVDRSSALLERSTAKGRNSAEALRLMIDTVTQGTNLLGKITSGSPEHRESASWRLSQSYAHQVTNNLPAALEEARHATQLAPTFGFAWARLAELEFGFGRTRAAHSAVDLALKSSPENPQAIAVKGFLLAAQHQLTEAIQQFDRALEIDPALGNAWLGRGLCKRRLGILAPKTYRDSNPTQTGSWLSDLQTAAAVEPGRSLVRANSGKAFSEAGDDRLALKELLYAAELDPGDPTPPLFTALELQRQNRPNEAVRELQRSIELNDNRAIYRSRLLLDQDHAVRGASLAKIYQDAGMEEVAVREASRAVSYDYASHSAHQFLAESYNALRDPTRFNLRYETVWFNELLLANILSPVGAGLLSQNISLQEYSKLFEANRVGMLSSTEYRSDGQFREVVSQYGLLGKSAYTLDLDYQRNEGTHPNNDLNRIEWYTQFKHQLNDRDSIFLLTKYQDYESGDNFQHYDPASTSKQFRFRESQTPLALMAVHREWSPGVHTTFLGGRLVNDQNLEGSFKAPRILLNAPTPVFSPLDFTNLIYQSEFEIYQVELNQVVQRERHTWVIGGRQQWGDFDTSDSLLSPASINPSFAASSNSIAVVNTSIERTSAYVYHTIAVTPKLHLSGGVTYDLVKYPLNYRFPPIEPGIDAIDGFSPKSALIWDLEKWLTLRGTYSTFRGGVSLEESFRLEPSQMAGFSQAYRNVISETEVGSIAVPQYHLGGLALDCRPGPNTYVGLEWQRIQSAVDEQIGVYLQRGSATRSTIHEALDYQEDTFGISLHQLLDDQWSTGLSYHLMDSSLQWSYPGLVVVNNPSSNESALLHRLQSQFTYNHSTGWFGRLDANWLSQSSQGYPNSIHAESRSTDRFYQLNFYAGFRFMRRRGEITAGILNLTDQDYRLNSLTPYPDLPRERVFTARVRLNF